MFDWTVNLGNVIAIVFYVALGIGFIYTMKNKIDAMSNRLATLEEDLKKLIDVLIAQGKQEERLIALDQRVAAQGLRLDDLTKRFNYLTDKS